MDTTNGCVLLPIEIIIPIFRGTHLNTVGTYNLEVIGTITHQYLIIEERR